MDNSPATEPSSELLTIACRFVPYDQWFITHVDASWKVAQVKSWLLAKCYNSFSSPRNASNSTSATPSASIPPINPPERPRRHTAHRPASPIVFAPERPSGSGRGGIDSDDDLEGDGHYYDEHGIYGAGDPDTAAKAGNAKDTSEGKSFTGVSSISYVSQISGLSYASTASKYSQRSGYSHSSHLSQVSEASSQTRSPVSTEDTHGLPMIDTAFGQEKNKTDTIRPRSKRGPRGPRRPVSPMTFAPMGKTPTSGQATKGGFGEYETYSTYSPDDSAPNFALPLVGATTSQATNEKDGDIASIESNSTLPAYSGKFSRGDAYKRILGLENNNNNSSDEEGTQFTMGYEEDGEDAYDEDDEYEEEPGHGKEKEEDYDDNQPPPGTGRVGPAPIVPNRPGTSHSTASSPSNHPSTTSLAMGNLFSSRKEKDSKDKGKDKEKRKEKKKDKDKQKEKHRSKLEKADRGDRTRDWVEVERSREKERELFTSSISAMSGISTKPRKDTRERDRDRERERRDRKVYGPLQKRADHTPSYETYHPMLVTVMRFSTGQILEDHFALGWYELKPYELLEIHRRGVILTLPRTLTVDYISPYWEGYVRALRVVLRGPNNLAVSGVAPGSSSSRGKDIREIQENRRREQVERHSSIRERGSDHRDPRSESRAHKRKESSALSRDDGKDGRPDAQATGSQSGQHHRPNNEHHDTRRGRMVKLDWRERWVFIKDGILNVWKDREDATTAQYLPLSDLTDIRGADQLGRSLTISSAFGASSTLGASSTTTTSRPTQPGQPRGQSDISGLRGMLGSTASASSQRIVCAKFKGKLRDGSHKADEVKEKRASMSLDPSHVSAYAHARTSASAPQSGSVPTGSSAGGRANTSRPSSKQSSSNAKQPQSLPSGSPPTSNPASLPSSPTLRPQISAPISLRMQENQGVQGDEGKDSVIFRPPRASYPYIKDKGKGRALPQDGHESDDEAEGGMSDGNMSALGLVTTAVESPSAVTRPGGIRPLPSLPSTPAYPGHFDKVSDSKPDVKLDGKDNQDNDSRSTTLGVHPNFDNELVDEDLTGFSSDGSLSSPVFAHSDDDSDDSNTRRGYGYGFNERKKLPKVERDGEGRRLSLGAPKDRTASCETKADEKRGQGGNEGESDNAAGEADSSYVYVEGNERPSIRPRETTAHSTPRSRTRTREKESSGEWIVLDLRDDHAFRSFLRVLHRYAPHILQSTFLSQLPYYTPPAQITPTSSTPNAYPTFFSDERKGDERLSRVLENPEMVESSATVDSNTVTTSSQTDSTTNTPLTASTFQSSVSSHTQLSSMSTSPSAQSLHHRNLPSLAIPDPISDLSSMRAKGTSASLAISRHGLNALLHHPPDAFGTFGALPYPEWRTKLVLRAQRAGLGELNKAMEWFLFKGDQSHDLGITSSLQGFGAGNSQPPLERSSSLDAEDSNDPDSAVSSKRERRRRRERHMTIEQENIAIGISTENTGPVVDSPADGDSVRTAGKSANVKVHIPDSESTDSGEESSDTEWLGWMADLHRQAKLLKEQEVKKLHAEEDEDEHLSEYNPQDDHRRYQEKQMLLEPSAVVVVTSPSQSTTTPPVSRSISHSAVSTSTPVESFGSGFPILTSPSSNESLGRPRGRKQSFGISSVDQPSSTTSPSTTSRLERSSSGSRTQHQRQPSNSRTPNLLHFASSGYIVGSAQATREKDLSFGSGTSAVRRPSMPALSSASQTQALSTMTSTVSAGHASSPLNPNTSFLQQQQTSIAAGTGSISRSTAPPKALMVPASPGVGSGSGFNIASSPRLPIGSTGSNTVPRRSSTAGLTLTANSSVSSVSLGRSGSMLSKTPALLRRKDGESEKARRSEAKELKDKTKGKSKEKEKESKGKLKEGSPYGDVSVDFRESRRPRLSVSTANSPYQPTEAQTAVSRTQSPQPTSPTASASNFVSRQVRRVRSGSSLMSEGTSEWHQSIETPRNNPPVKKKRGIMRGMTMRAEKLISNLESTLDFVDARQ